MEAFFEQLMDVASQATPPQPPLARSLDVGGSSGRLPREVIFVYLEKLYLYISQRNVLWLLIHVDAMDTLLFFVYSFAHHLTNLTPMYCLDHF
ncbi:unnamed protein product, partial [Urochloa humidicola]